MDCETRLIQCLISRREKNQFKTDERFPKHLSHIKIENSYHTLFSSFHTKLVEAEIGVIFFKP